MGEAPLAAGIDQHGRRAGGSRGVAEQAVAVHAFRLEPLPDEAAPLVAAHVGEGGRLHPEPGHGHARVRDDAARGELERLGRQEHPLANGYVEGNGPNQEIGHARTANHAIDVRLHRRTV